MSEDRKLLKPLAALGAFGTIVSIWWFALRPRRKKRKKQSA
jgi:cbb3-type cytochrome oxidase subunit 3